MQTFIKKRRFSKYKTDKTIRILTSSAAENTQYNFDTITLAVSTGTSNNNENGVMKNVNLKLSTNEREKFGKENMVIPK